MAQFCLFPRFAVVIQSLLGANWRLGKPICSTNSLGKNLLFAPESAPSYDRLAGSRYFKLIFIETFPALFQESSPAKSRNRKLTLYPKPLVRAKMRKKK